MKRLALAVALAAALALVATALAGGTLTGKYTAKLTSPAQLKGTWTLNFVKGGTYTVADNGTVLIHGHDTTSGSKVTFAHETGPAACKTAGKYSWKRSGKTLKFTRISDTPCVGRSAVLARTFTQA